MCGIVGIYSENHVASSIYDSLLMLQHRGQDAAGMMMLTLPTAASVGVTNRLDPIQSIHGGAKYIADLKSDTNYGTSSGDKIAFILAAYNLGITNIRNAIDAIDKKPIDVTWLDLEEHLLNLKTSMDTENYSRGQQTVDFVERVRDYYYLLLAQNCSGN